MSEPRPPLLPMRPAVAAAIGALVAAALAAAFGVQHDYAAYVEHWADVRQDLDGLRALGQATGAYGPAHNLFAPVAGLHPLLPKIVFAGSWGAVSGWLVARARPGRSRWLVLALTAGPYTLVEVVGHGHNDILVAVATVAGVHLLRQGRFAGGSLVLALGTLLKYLPAVAWVAAVATLAERGRLRVAAWSAGILAAGLAVATLAFDVPIADPIRFGFDRGPSLLNPISAFTSIEPIGDWLSAINPVVVVAAFVAALTWSVRRRLDPLVSAALCVLAVLVAYQVGHSQFRLAVVLLLALLVGVHRVDEHWTAWQWRMVVLYLAFMSTYILAYDVVDEFTRVFDPLIDPVRPLMVVPAFVLECGVLAVLATTRLAAPGIAPDQRAGEGTRVAV